MRFLTDGICSNSSLISLRLKSRSVSQRYGWMSVLGEALKVNTSITSLNLKEPRSDSPEMKIWGDLVDRNSSLRSIKISSTA